MAWAAVRVLDMRLEVEVEVVVRAVELESGLGME